MVKADVELGGSTRKRLDAVGQNLIERGTPRTYTPNPGYPYENENLVAIRIYQSTPVQLV